MLEIIIVILSVIASFWAGYRIKEIQLEEREHIITLLIQEILHLRGEEIEVDDNEKN